VGGSSFFRGQALHLAGLALLLASVEAARSLPGFSEGELFGVSTAGWFRLAVGEAVLHQVYVWICWRLELGTQAITRAFGARAFGLYAAGFTLLIVARPLLAVALAVANAGTLPLRPPLCRALALVALIPVVYLGYSVGRYFGFSRAYGADHFDPVYRSAPIVREGIFRFTSNAMYAFGFLLLWAPALWLRSTAGLVFAAFSHAYIWVHYFATERPDMRVIYGPARPPAGSASDPARR